MKKTIMAMTIAVAAIAACKNKSSDPQSTPRAVAETIFEVARNGNYDGLGVLIDAGADGDSKRIGQVATDKSVQEEFKKYFSKGKVSAEPVINGEKASVPVLFGPEETDEETFEMVQRNGKWYLLSF